MLALCLMLSMTRYAQKYACIIGGSLLFGSLLFILYVNDILINSKVKKSADDNKIYTQIKIFIDVVSFQNDLDKLCGWARE